MCIGTGYEEDTKRTADTAFDDFGRVCRHGRIWKNTIDFWEFLEHAQTGPPCCPRLFETLSTRLDSKMLGTPTILCADLRIRTK